MTKTHWKQFYNYEYMGAHSIQQDTTVTIESYKYDDVTGDKGRTDKCLILHFKEFEDGYIINKTNSKRITEIYGSPYVEDWVGKKITLYIEKNAALLRNKADEALWVRPVKPKSEAQDKKSQIKAQIRDAWASYTGADKKELGEQLRKRDDLQFLEETLKKVTNA